MTKLDDILREERIDQHLRETLVQLPRIAVNAGNASVAANTKQPIVEYLEDSKVSVEFFKMKGSVFFSAIGKEDLDPIKKDLKDQKDQKERNEVRKKPTDESIRFFNISAANQDEFMLSAIAVGLIHLDG